MFLKKKIAASSLAEVVIALAVIALCFGVASMVFTRSVMVTTGFEEVRVQTEIQSRIWEQLQNGEPEMDFEGIEIHTEADALSDSLLVDSYLGLNGRMIWNQQRLKDE
jgi:hypothetical protein